MLGDGVIQAGVIFWVGSGWVGLGWVGVMSRFQARINFLSSESVTKILRRRNKD